MKSFKQYIKEDKGGNNSSNLSYKPSTGGQQATAAAIVIGTQSGLSDFIKGPTKTSSNTAFGAGGINVAEWWGKEEEMKPWQVRCADIAAMRHATHLKWLSAVDPNHTTTIPELPDWQRIPGKKQ